MSPSAPEKILLKGVSTLKDETQPSLLKQSFHFLLHSARGQAILQPSTFGKRASNGDSARQKSQTPAQTLDQTTTPRLQPDATAGSGGLPVSDIGASPLQDKPYSPDSETITMSPCSDQASLNNDVDANLLGASSKQAFSTNVLKQALGTINAGFISAPRALEDLSLLARRSASDADIPPTYSPGSKTDSPLSKTSDPILSALQVVLQNPSAFPGGKQTGAMSSASKPQFFARNRLTIPMNTSNSDVPPQPTLETSAGAAMRGTLQAAGQIFDVTATSVSPATPEQIPSSGVSIDSARTKIDSTNEKTQKDVPNNIRPSAFSAQTRESNPDRATPGIRTNPCGPIMNGQHSSLPATRVLSITSATDGPPIIPDKSPNSNVLSNAANHLQRETRSTLPRPDTQLSSESATADATLGLSGVRLIQHSDGAEMTVGIHSTEFGVISIRTSSTRDHVSAEVSVEHDELAKSILEQLPTIEMHDRTVGIRVHHSAAFDTGSNETPNSRGNADDTNDEPRKPIAAGLTSAPRAPTLEVIPAPGTTLPKQGSRLSVTA